MSNALVIDEFVLDEWGTNFYKSENDFKGQECNHVLYCSSLLTLL